MSGLLSYSGITTKIRAKEGHFLSDDEFREIADLDSVPQVFSYLKKKSAYEVSLSKLDEGNLHRGQIEAALSNSLYQSFSALYSFADIDQRKFLRLYFRRYEVMILKQCLTNIFDHRETKLELIGFHRFRLDIDRLQGVKTIEEFVAAVKGTKYYEPMNQVLKSGSAQLFDYEVALDLSYFRHIWEQKDKILKKKDLELITRAYGSKFDMLNLWWIHRAKSYFNMKDVDIYALLIPVRYKLRKEQITALVEAETPEIFQSVLKKTYYGRIYDLQADALEDMYTYVLKHVLIRESKQEPYSAATLYSYLYQREHEYRRLIIAIECIRYKVSAEETLAHIAKA